MFDIFKKLDRYKKEPTEPLKPVEYLIVGLGNPGLKYENTRHNAGFIAIDYFLKQKEHEGDKHKFNAICNRCNINSKGVLVMRPQTFMNLSGESVVPAMKFYKIQPENVLVIFDDIELPVGKLRIRRKGSAGGHNGMKNIVNLSGSTMFPRIKIGIGAKPHPDYDLVDWVLSTFTKEEKEKIDIASKNVYDAIPYVLDGDFETAMNKYN